MLVRYLSGIRGAALAQGTIGAGATVSAPDAIAARTAVLMP